MGDNKSKEIPDMPGMPMSIGRTTYLVNIRFSDTATETMVDKISRMVQNDLFTELRGEMPTN